MPRITLLDMLAQAGLIDRRQFDEALQNRVLYGGKIGTNLIELGFVKEEDLARFLAKKLAVPYVPPDLLLNLPPAVTSLLPAELARKYQAVPLRLEKKRLSLAMADPADLKAVDEIAFVTGYIITPVVAPEVRLIQALGKYYDAEIDGRYARIIERIEEERRVAAAKRDEEKREAEARREQEEREAAARREKEEREAAAKRAEEEKEAAAKREKERKRQPPKKAAQPAAPTPPPPPAEPAVPVPGTKELLEEAEVVGEDWKERVRRYSVDFLSRTLAKVESREEIGAALIGYLDQEFRRSGIFIIRGGEAIGWKGIAEGTPIPSFQNFHLPLGEPSVLAEVAQEMAPRLGPLEETQGNIQIAAALRGGWPEEVLLMPLTVLGRVVLIVYVHGEPKIAARVPDLQRLLAKAALAFEILICREKILML